jgi:hypothetical protein
VADLPPRRDALTRDELVAEFVAAIRAEGHTGAVTHDTARDRIVVEGRGEIGVEQLYAQLARSPRERRSEALSKAARYLVSPPRIPDAWEEAREKVLPLARRRMEIVAEDVRRETGEGPAPTFRAEFTEHLVFELGYPTELGTLTVPLETLGRWGLRPEEAFRQASENLIARSGGDWLVSPEAPGVFRSPWRDGFDVARLVSPALFSRLPLRGRPVVMAPLPSTLLVTGSESEEGLFQLGLAAKRIVDRQRLFHVLRTLRLGADGLSWEDWLPPTGHPANPPLRLLRALQDQRDHEEFADLIRALAAKKKAEAPRMAPLLVRQSVLGAEIATFTVWRSGAAVALPKADAIVFQRGGETLGLADWDDVLRALPKSLKPMPGYPPRFLATDFPEEWQLGEIDLEPWTGPGPT